MKSSSPMSDLYDDNDFDPVTPSDSDDENDRPLTEPLNSTPHLDKPRSLNKNNTNHDLCNDSSIKITRKTDESREGSESGRTTRGKSPSNSMSSYSHTDYKASVRDGNFSTHLEYGGHDSSSVIDTNKPTNIASPFLNGKLSRFSGRDSRAHSQGTYPAKDDDYADDFDNDDYLSDFEDQPKSRKSYSDDIQENNNRRDVTNTVQEKEAIVSGFQQHHREKSHVKISSNPYAASRQSILSKKGSRNTANRKLYSHLNSYSRQSRIPSALHVNVDHLRKDITEITDEIENLKIENKVLKRNNTLLTRQLEKKEKEEIEMPTLYDKQTKELKALKDHLKRSKERYEKADDRLRIVERELRQSQKEEKDLEAIAEEEDLKERSRLRKQLERIVILSDEADQRITQLEKYAENLEKCHESEMSAENEKHRQTLAMFHELTEQSQQLKQTIQSKETELDRYRIQHTSRMAISRAHVNTALSGVIYPHTSSSEQSGAQAKASTHHSRAGTAVLKALPAPPSSVTSELVNKHAQNLNPSPPASSRPNKNNTRLASPAKTMKSSYENRKSGKRLSQPKRIIPSHAAVQLSAAAEELRREKEDERKAELQRTNLVLSQKSIQDNQVNMQYNTYDFEVAEKSSSARSYATSNHQVKQDKDLSRDSVGLSLSQGTAALASRPKDPSLFLANRECSKDAPVPSPHIEEELMPLYPNRENTLNKIKKTPDLFDLDFLQQS